MSLLYKDKKDIIYSVDFKTYPDGKVKLFFSCDGGKHGSDEFIDEYIITVSELLSLLRKHDKDSEHVCENCAQRIGEECGITGLEVYPNSSCNQFCAS